MKLTNLIAGLAGLPVAGFGVVAFALLADVIGADAARTGIHGGDLFWCAGDSAKTNYRPLGRLLRSTAASEQNERPGLDSASRRLFLSLRACLLSALPPALSGWWSVASG
jgi:hypothetical protein